MVNCRICKGKLTKIIDLGKISLVGNFSRKSKKEKKFKISLNFCIKCKHVQIAEILNPNLLFICWDHYVPAYVRKEIKQKTGIVVDSNGNKVENKVSFKPTTKTESKSIYGDKLDGMFSMD